MCYEKHGYLLRTFKLKNKFRRLAMKDKSKQKIIRKLSSCLFKKYGGFGVISVEFERKQRKKFTPIDITYKSTKRIEIEQLCYFSEDI